MKNLKIRIRNLEQARRGDPHGPVFLVVPKDVPYEKRHEWADSKLIPCGCGNPDCRGPVRVLLPEPYEDDEEWARKCREEYEQIQASRAKSNQEQD